MATAPAVVGGPHVTGKKRAQNPTITPSSGVPNNAHAILNDFLANYGLQSLGDWAWQTYTAAGGGALGMQVVQAELPNQQAFKARFPAIGQRVQQGLPPITVTDYMNYEQGLRQAFVQNGIALPISGAQFSQIVSGLLVKDVSLSEVVNDRIGKALSGYVNAPAEVKAAYEQVYGIHGASALATQLLDPKLAAPEIDKLAQASQLLGTGRHFGINMSVHQAIALAGQDAGASGTGAQQFFKLGQLTPLFHENAGETTDLTAAGQGVGFEFGTDAAAAIAVQRRLTERQAAFAGGGGPAVTNSGVVGLGPAPQT